MKRVISAGLSILLLACLSSAMAGTAGTSSDPLASLSYINDEYVPSVVAQGEDKIDATLESVYEAAASLLDGGNNAAEGSYRFASGYDSYIVPANASVEAVTGSSVIVTSGTAVVTIKSGAVINVAAGEEVASGTVLVKNQRYFCAEDTVAVFTASSEATMNVNGTFSVSGGAEAVLSQYIDVSPLDWYYSAVKYVYEGALYYDRNESLFRPDEPTTRGMLVYALWIASGSPKAGSEAGFSDITEDWYSGAVAWAAENGIVNGYENNVFKPNNSITREEIAAIMYRYACYMGHSTSKTNDLSKYVDASLVSSWAEKEMRWANAEGLITGMTAVELAPQGTATRAQVATIIMRYLESH